MDGIRPTLHHTRPKVNEQFLSAGEIKPLLLTSDRIFMRA